MKKNMKIMAVLAVASVAAATQAQPWTVTYSHRCVFKDFAVWLQHQGMGHGAL